LNIVYNSYRQTVTSAGAITQTIGKTAMYMSESTSAVSPPHDTVSRWLIVILLIVTAGCWSAMIYSTWITYREAPPLPARFVSETGETLITRADIVAGKSAFQKADLMDYGSLYGMGSYFGEDYTAEYLVQLARATEDAIARERYGLSLNQISKEQELIVRAQMQKQLRQIDLTAEQISLSTSVSAAVRNIRARIVHNIMTDNPEKGWTRAYSLTDQEARQLADFLVYSSLTTVALRPGSDYSWTNNWPTEPLVGNEPTAATFQWTWASFTLVFFMIGVVVAIFRLFIEHPAREETPARTLVEYATLTLSQKSLWKYFVVVALVLLLQIVAGGILAHYYSERASFYGIPINSWLPFAFLRSVHLQAPIIWIGVAWIASALFLAPVIGGGEPRGQRLLVNLLFWVTLLIVVGALTGNYLGIMGVIHEHWFWFGNQGLSYLELGRFWQFLFFVGLLGWSLILLRAMWPTLLRLVRGRALFSLFRIEHLLWYSTLGVAVIYAFGMIPLSHPAESFTIADFWRWWVVHLWVEWAFELFTAAVTGYILMALGLVSRQLAERAVLFEWILILVSGILGTGHHMYWAGEPGLWIGVGSVFSFLEVLPLFLLVLEAIQQRERIREIRDFRYGLAYLYILGSAFWNFVGAGVFGGATINAPLVNFYEHATFLTLNHAHTAMFGAFGLLAIGLVYLCLRYVNSDNPGWSDRNGRWAFWLYNWGMVLWVLLNFFPIGWPQLQAVYEHGLAYARSLEFYEPTTLWQWMRFPGDVVFAAGALLMAWDFIVKLRGIATGRAGVPVS
jgi:nitric oxide reductase subunit B